ncbi:uncharacterized protein TNCV_1143831 [Trichonephila clavipes]|nr:uncharacterized protein TNCV_1143831 [Trichonephila clavipes]
MERRDWDVRRLSKEDDRRRNWTDAEIIHKPNDRRNNYVGNYENGRQMSQGFDCGNRFNMDNRRFNTNDRRYQFRMKKSSAQVITPQGAKCRNEEIVELHIRIREFVKPWQFHVLEESEYPCILGVDFISGSKIVLDFDRKSLEIPDSQVEKVIPSIDEGNLEIVLTKAGLEESQKHELQDLFNSFKGLCSDKPGLTHVLYHEIDMGISHQLFPGRIGMIG